MIKHNESHIQYIARTTNKTQQDIFGLLLDELQDDPNEFGAIIDVQSSYKPHGRL